MKRSTLARNVAPSIAPAPGFGAIRSGSAASSASSRSSNVVIGISISSCRIGVRNPNR